ncbi:HlyD family efflux transporter periplasmic adaptor subunit [Rhodobacter sp. NTK016B]|uniref:efflux RND transporter periplasmic adaptor subunit n=1 Tax=Rhodobacter sp. NTK016B TaxID=2759676 RepID=UPI001A8C7C43|nr:HlyD family efflux transporter periplasmic adaptor subunit [Rhodobacter sp. NTK016B]MBN8293587.1 HlyD family efflux transporter periplasmic adaptor subunit [Rhodobacter sp. NTK016B]
MSVIRKTGLALGALALAAALGWALWPQPQAVDLAQVTRGDLQVSVAAEGVTRVREPYSVTAPIAGIVERSPVAVGDEVTRGETIIAVIRPAEPALMDSRARAQAEAAVREAEAALALAETNLRRALTGLSHAQSELQRGRALAASGTISQRALEDVEAAFTEASQALAAARSERDLRAATLGRAQAQLMEPSGDDGVTNAVPLFAPISGQVLDVTDPSSRLVQAGAPLLSLGDLRDLDIEIDLLSADAVQVSEGAPARVERWGGAGTLDAVVRRIEPAAFTRVSALGIEEQRVRLRLDFVTPPEERPGLGDRYRVFVHVVTWQGRDLLLVPQAALFRQGEGWALFRVINGRAALTPVGIGRQSNGMAEVTQGLTEGDTVILYPASSLEDAAAIVARDG